MTKTGQQIEDDVFQMLKNDLSQFEVGMPLSGKLYKFGDRPRDSHLEDVVVKFVTGYDDQIQTGRVAICFYVPDVNVYKNGIFTKYTQRCREIEIAANKWAESLTAGKSDYLFKKSQTVCTEQEKEINQHFISLKLKFKLPTF